MNKFKIKILLFSFLSFVLTGYSEVSLLEEIIAGIKYRENLIKDWKATCLIKTKYPDGKIETIKEIWAQKGAKIYREKILQKENIEEVIIASFNEEILYVLHSIKNGRKRGVIDIPAKNVLKNAFFNSSISTSLFNTLFIKRKSIRECLLENSQKLYIQKINYNSEECYLIKWEEKEGEAIFNFTIFISPVKGFLPLRIIENAKGKEIEMEILTDNTYVKYGDIYFLRKSIQHRTTYIKNLEKRENIDEIEVENVEINKDIPDSFFEIKFPEGTKVYDERTGVTYEIK